MRRILIILPIVVIVFSMPFADAHPDILEAKLIINGQDTNTQFIGLKSESNTKQIKDPEIFSIAWVYQNFFWILGSVIVITMTIVFVLTYREELVDKFNLKKDKIIQFKR